MNRTLKIICISILFLFSISIYINKTNGLSIVGYHGVVSDEDKENLYKDDPYYLSISQFQRHMKYLYDHDYQTLSMQEVEDYYKGNNKIHKKSVVLTFDDGYKNFNDIVKPILQQYNFKATCFVIGKHVSDERKEFLKANDLNNSENIHYYSHSYDLHRKANRKKIIEVLSLDEINDDFNRRVVDHTYFAYPYGKNRNDMNELLEKQNVHLAFTYNNYYDMTSRDDQYALPRYMIVEQMPDFYIHWLYK